MEKVIKEQYTKPEVSVLSFGTEDMMRVASASELPAQPNALRANRAWNSLMSRF